MHVIGELQLLSKYFFIHLEYHFYLTCVRSSLIFFSIFCLFCVHVLVQQTGPPRITFSKRQFTIGENLIANCTTSKAHPAPHITWLINGKQVNMNPMTIATEHKMKTKSFLAKSVFLQHIILCIYTIHKTATHRNDNSQYYTADFCLWSSHSFSLFHLLYQEYESEFHLDDNHFNEYTYQISHVVTSLFFFSGLVQLQLVGIQRI